MPRTTRNPEDEPDHQARALVEAARVLLATEGPSALTVRRIAAESGWSTMGVYSRFGGKSGVVEQLWLEGFAELGNRLSGVPRTDDPAHDLLALGHAYREAALANATTYAVMFGRAVPDFEPSAKALATAVDVFLILVAGAQRVIDAGRFRNDDPEEIAFVLWATTHGFASLEIAGYGDKPPTIGGIAGKGPRHLFDVACRALLQGFAAE